MARIEIHADDRVADRITQEDQRLRVVDTLRRDVLQRDLLNAVLVCEGDHLLPVWNQHLIPLPLEDLGDDRRPAGCDPVGRRVLRRAARTARGHDDRLDAEQSGKLEGLFNDDLIASALFVRGKLVARAVECLQLESALLNRRHVILARLLALEHLVQIDMRRLGPVAAGDLNGFVSQLCDGVQHFFKRHVAEAVGVQAKSHVSFLPKICWLRPSVRDRVGSIPPQKRRNGTRQR